MRSTIILAASAMAGLLTHAFAFSKSDLFCKVTDAQHNVFVYAFANNSNNADGSVGGTMVETGFSKNGKDVYAPVGARPIWVTWANGIGGLTIQSRNNPEWGLVMGQITRANGLYSASASLLHNTRVVANGECMRDAPDTAGTVSDRGL